MQFKVVIIGIKTPFTEFLIQQLLKHKHIEIYYYQYIYPYHKPIFGTLKLLVNLLKKKGLIYTFDHILLKIYNIFNKREKRFNLFTRINWDYEIRDKIKIATFKEITLNNDIYNGIKSFDPDLIALSAAPLIPKKIIESAKYCVNFHAGILPYYKGVDTIVHALANYDMDKVGYTIHFVNEYLDRGDIIKKVEYEAKYYDSINELTEQIIYFGYLDYIESIKMLLQNNKIVSITDNNKDKGKIYTFIGLSHYYKAITNFNNYING